MISEEILMIFQPGYVLQITKLSKLALTDSKQLSIKNGIDEYVVAKKRFWPSDVKDFIEKSLSNIQPEMVRVPAPVLRSLIEFATKIHW